MYPLISLLIAAIVSVSPAGAASNKTSSIVSAPHVMVVAGAPAERYKFRKLRSSPAKKPLPPAAHSP